MKTVRNILAAVFILFGAASFAQGNLEEVIYLKDGSIYRGVIVETVPQVSYKIQIAGGSIINIKLADVMKTTKEERIERDEMWGPGRMGFGEGFHGGMGRFHSGYGHDSTQVPSYMKKRGRFFMAELRGGPGNGSIRLVHGFKMGRFGFLGIGIGVDGASFTERHMWRNVLGDNNSPVSDGIYLPLYLRYSGDILRARVTPFYYVEAGYAAHPTGKFMFNDNANRSWGGPVGAVGIGCKFNSRHRVNFNVNVNANFRSNYFRESFFRTDQFGNTVEVHNRQWDRMLFGALGFGIGF
ncbi:MAG: hypothetical protein IPP77_00595 [Bacteroidetes bacterium]|nr:hypothetical protein [Bacteroidota bacterium]